MQSTKVWYIWGATVLLLAGVFGVFVVGANPQFFMPRKLMKTATTTVTYMTPGTATTTFAFDTFQNSSNNAVNGLALAIQFTASSSPRSTLKWHYEYSPDNIDWYPEQEVLTTVATTTLYTLKVKEHSWQFASSTYYDYGNGTATLGFKIVDVPVYARYVRTKFYMERTDSSNRSGAVWAEYIGRKEQSE